MRIVSYDEFMKIPTPFLYVELGTRDRMCYFQSEACINWSLGNYGTWVLSDTVLFPDYKAVGHSEDDVWEAMEKDSELDVPARKESGTISSGVGCYGKDHMFLVYSKDDAMNLMTQLNWVVEHYGKSEDAPSIKPWHDEYY